MDACHRRMKPNLTSRTPSLIHICADIRTVDVPSEYAQKNLDGAGVAGRKALEDYIEWLPNAENGFRCTLCSKTFSRKGHAVNHLENIHFPQAFEYSCKHCGSVFSSKNTLYKHVHKEHKNN